MKTEFDLNEKVWGIFGDKILQKEIKEIHIVNVTVVGVNRMIVREERYFFETFSIKHKTNREFIQLAATKEGLIQALEAES